MHTILLKLQQIVILLKLQHIVILIQLCALDGFICNKTRQQAWSPWSAVVT